MRFPILAACAVAGSFLSVSAAYAESYLCAVGEVYECEAVNGCKRTSTAAINLSDFILVDTDKKQMTSASLGEKSPTSEDIEGVSTTDKNVFLYGTQGTDTWNATISLETGGLTGGISSGTSSFALFGACTKK